MRLHVFKGANRCLCWHGTPPLGLSCAAVLTSTTHVCNTIGHLRPPQCCLTSTPFPSGFPSLSTNNTPFPIHPSPYHNHPTPIAPSPIPSTACPLGGLILPLVRPSQGPTGVCYCQRFTHRVWYRYRTGARLPCCGHMHSCLLAHTAVEIMLGVINVFDWVEQSHAARVTKAWLVHANAVHGATSESSRLQSGCGSQDATFCEAEVAGQTRGMGVERAQYQVAMRSSFVAERGSSIAANPNLGWCNAEHARKSMERICVMQLEMVCEAGPGRRQSAMPHQLRCQIMLPQDVHGGNI